jgi:hypothetical protein
MLQRNGEVAIKMLANVQQKTIEPFIKRFIAKGSLIYTDEYCIYLCPTWGMTACRSGDISIKLSITLLVSMLVTRTVMASMRCMSTASRASGHCFVLGSDPTEASHKRSCRCTWAFSSSFTTSNSEEGLSCRLSSRFW